ncbi:MAG: sigma factor-like helix-turn-helix DNA-binding protein [Patescibacteria group bacterium]
MSIVTTEITDIFSSILASLADKERSVISRRIGLAGTRETLQEIGDTYGITRERVRQIEDVGIKKIGRIMRTSPLMKIQESGEKILKMHGGVMTRDRLINAIIADIGATEALNMNIVDVLLQADFNLQRSKPQLGTNTYFHFPEVSKKLIESAHKEAVKLLKKRGDIIETSAFYEMIKGNLFPAFGKVEPIMIDSIMDIYIDIVKGEEKFIGLEAWKILNPSTLKDKAIYVLKKKKEPMHFLDIASAITEYFAEPVKVSTIHNELIRNAEFVLIGRGIYVLKEWGYKDGTVLDVVLDIFKKAGAPLSTEEITARVLKIRQVKTTTIYMNLQNKKYIERVGRNLYQAKTK